MKKSAFQPSAALLTDLGFVSQPEPLAPTAVRFAYNHANPRARSLELRNWGGEEPNNRYCLIGLRAGEPLFYAYSEWVDEQDFRRNLLRAMLLAGKPRESPAAGAPEGASR